MIVETFEIERTVEELDAIRDGAAQEIIEKLGLEGQSRFYKADTMEAVPYRKMTKLESEVYGVLCKERCKPEAYSDGLIPLRVLQVYEHAKSLEFFDRFEVWYPESADIKDPVLVGYKEEKIQQSWGMQTVTERYLLARWGEVLEPLAELHKLAVQMWRTSRIGKLQSILAQVTSELNILQNSEEVDLSKTSPAYHS
jgi:hypothetical protein